MTSAPAHGFVAASAPWLWHVKVRSLGSSASPRRGHGDAAV